MSVSPALVSQSPQMKVVKVMLRNFSQPRARKRLETCVFFLMGFHAHETTDWVCSASTMGVGGDESGYSCKLIIRST